MSSEFFTDYAYSTPAQVDQWKAEAMNKILALTDTAGQEDIVKYFNAAPSPRNSGAGPSGIPPSSKPPATSPGRGNGKQVKRSPMTPDGVTPSKRDGKIAAILCYSPWAP